MAYWHQDENGRWLFDWSHLYPVLAIMGFVAVAVAKSLWGG